MKDSSSLLKAIDACESKNNARCHVSSPESQRSATIRVGRAVLSSGARMSAASASCDVPPDCDVEIISEKTVKSPVVEKNGAKIDEVERQGKLTSRFTFDKSKDPIGRVVQVPNECGIGSYNIVYSESPAVKRSSTESIAVGTIGERIKADGKDKVIFNGTEWVSLRSSNNRACSDQDSASDTRPGVSVSSANQVALIPSSSSNVTDRPSLITLRPLIGSTSGTGVAVTPGGPGRMQLSCKPATFSCKESPPANTSTGTGCCSSGASDAGFYGKSKISDCVVRIPFVTGRGRQNCSPCRVSGVSVAGPPVRSAAPVVASVVVASTTVAKCSSAATAIANRSRVGVVTRPGASSPLEPLTAATAQPNKPVVGLAKRGRGRPRRQLPPTETVVLSSDEESDEVNTASSPPKRRRLSAEADSVSVNADDDLFPYIESPNGPCAQRQAYSRRLVMQLPQQSRSRTMDQPGDRKREQMEQWPDAEQSCPQSDSFVLHAIEVRIGTMSCKPVNELVQFSIKQGIRMSLYSGCGDYVNIRIDGRDLNECVAHFSKSLAVLFLSCKAALGIKLRHVFRMTDASQQYYDPYGIDEAQKYIVVIFDCGTIAEPTVEQRRIANYFQELGKKCGTGEQLCSVVQLADANNRLAQLRPIATPAACGSTRGSGSPSGHMPTSSARLDKRLASGERDQGKQPLIAIGRRRCARLTTTASPSVQKRAIGTVTVEEPSMGNGGGTVHNTAGTDLGSGKLQPRHSTLGLAVDSSTRSPSLPSTVLRSSTPHPAGRRSEAAMPLDEEDDDGESDCSANRSPCISPPELPDDRAGAVSHDGRVAEMTEGPGTVCQETVGSVEAAGSEDERSPMQWQPSVSSDSQSSGESSPLALSATARRSLRFRDGAQCTAAADGGSRAKRLLLYPYPRVMGSIAVTTGDIACLEEEEFLNDVIVDFYLKYLFEERLSPDYRPRTHVFSSFFYMRLMQSGHARRPGDPQSSVKDRRHNGVKTWTRHVDVFDKDYLIVPINENSHWYLAVICFPSSIPTMFEALCKQPHETDLSPDTPPNAEAKGTSAELASMPGRSDDSEPNNTHVSDFDDGSSVCSGETPPVVSVDRTPPRPFILIFDSLGGGSRRSTSIRVLREYLEVEWRTRKGPAELTGPLRNLFTKESIPGCCPACPGQDNSCDCGIYLLQYVESFFEGPVMDYSTETTERLRNWFPQERIRRKRQDIKDLLNRMHMSFVQPKQQSADG